MYDIKWDLVGYESIQANFCSIFWYKRKNLKKFRNQNILKNKSQEQT
jgi:hypothetical protein